MLCCAEWDSPLLYQTLERWLLGVGCNLGTRATEVLCLGIIMGPRPLEANAHHLLIAQAMTSQNLPAASSRAWSLSSLPGPSCPASPPPPRTTGVHQRTSRILCTPMIGSAHQSFLCGPKKSPFIICCSVYAYTRRGLTSHVTLTLL